MNGEYVMMNESYFEPIPESPVFGSGELTNEYVAYPNDQSDYYLADYPIEARMIEDYLSRSAIQLESERVNVSSALSTPSLADVLGKFLEIGGKTATDIYKAVYAQPVLTAVPQTQSGLEKSLFYPLAQTRQTGLSTTVPVSSAGLPASIAGIPTSFLIIGVILILAVGFLK